MQMIFNITAIIVRIFANSFSNVFQKKLSCEGDNAVCVNFINYLLLSIICLPFISLINFNSFNNEFWFYVLLGGICGALANSFMVMALERGDLSVLGPINSYKAVIGLVFGMILLKEIPNFYGILGIILIIAGSYFIFDTLDEKFSIKVFKRKDIRYRIYALLFAAIEAVFIKKVIVLSSIPISFITTCFSGAVFSYLIMRFYKLHFRKEIKCISNNHIAFYISTAACFGIMTYTTAYVFKHMNVGYALSLFQLSIVLNLALGWKIFHEKDILKKFAGTLIILAGSTIIILLGH